MLAVELRRRLLVAAVLVWMAFIAMLHWVTIRNIPSSVLYVESKTRIPLVAAREWLRGVMTAPLNAP
jgi:hypothetical protein